MNEIMEKARNFILKNARLLERRLFQVHFEGGSPDVIARIIRTYQNTDGGLGHALEPDMRSPESQPVFIEFGLAALEEARCRDIQLAESLCDYLKTVSDNNGLVPFVNKSVYESPIAVHMKNGTFPLGLNPTAGICGLLHYQGVQHDWLSLASETCYKLLVSNPPLEAHTLLCASRMAQHMPDRMMAMNILDIISSALPKASFFIPEAPVSTYGLTPLHFAPNPDSICRNLFTQNQISSHIEFLAGQQQPDGGWPIFWTPPSHASELEWRGRWTLDAICRLHAYGALS